MIKLKRLIVENPDEAHYKDSDFDFTDPRVIGIFTVFKDKISHRTTCVVAKTTGYGNLIFKTDSAELQHIFDTEGLFDEFIDEFPSHPLIIDTLMSIGRLPADIDTKDDMEYRDKRLDTPVNGRVWYADDKSILVSLWNRTKDFGKYKDYIHKSLKLLGIQPTNPNIKYEFIDDEGEWLPESFLDKLSPKKISKDGEDLIKKMMRIQHTSPDAKRFINKLHTAPPDRLQGAADKLGMPVAKLKHLTGMYEGKGQLNEVPDEITVNNKNYDYTDRMVKWVVIFGKFYVEVGEEKKYDGWIAEKMWSHELYFGEKKIGKNDRDYGTHGALSFGANERGKVQTTYKDDRLLARIYLIKKVWYMGLWGEKSEVKQFKPSIEKFLKWAGIDPLTVMYQFKPMENDEWSTYETTFGIKKIKTRGTDEKWAEKLQLHLMPPEQKAALLKKLGAMKSDKFQQAADKLNIPKIQLKQLLGRDVAETIKECPDSIEVGNDSYDFESEEVKYVVIADKKNNYAYYENATNKIFLNGKYIGTAGETMEGFPSHTYLQNDIRNRKEYRGRGMMGNRNLDLRLYKVENQWYITSWQMKRTMRGRKNLIEKILKELMIDVTTALYQDGHMVDDVFLTYDEMFGKVESNPEMKPAWEAELQRQLHLMPPEQKAELLKKLGAADSDRWQRVADRLGVTKVELRRLLGRDVAENSLGNLSFSDYHDPDVPYEAKPRTNIGFQYGTPF